MGLCKISSSLVVGFMGLVLAHISYAQNSPQDYLDAHNVARAEVGVESLTWDDTVAAYAQNYANQRFGDCNLVHSGGPYVIWRNSLRLGCARVQCNSGGWFVICNYDPPGNYVGQRPFPENSNSSHSCIVAIY
ncbi:hypothetical protein AAG906_026318 [Vitis piasezkii]